jgi:hypothetical protein
MIVLPGKPLHTTRALTSRMAMKTRRSKHDSYLSLRGDDERGGLCPHQARLLWSLHDPPPTSIAWAAGARTTTRARVAAGARPTGGGRPNASAGASGVPSEVPPSTRPGRHRPASFLRRRGALGPCWGGRASASSSASHHRSPMDGQGRGTSQQHATAPRFGHPTSSKKCRQETRAPP